MVNQFQFILLSVVPRRGPPQRFVPGTGWNPPFPTKVCTRDWVQSTHSERDLERGYRQAAESNCCTASAPGYQDGCRQRVRARASRGGASAGGATCLDDEVHALLCGHPLRALSSRALLERSEETGREGERAAAAEALGSAPGSRGCVTSGTPVIGLDAGSPPSPSPQGGACTAVPPVLPAAARVRARLHARLCLTRAWPWHGQGALATDEVSETSERDLHFSDQDCSDTVNAADVGPKGAVAARWPESSCDSSPITDSGHHAEQHDQTRSQSRAGALQRPGSATTSPGTDKGSPVTAPTGNIRRHAVSSREVTAASRGIDGVEAEGHPVRRRSSVHRTSSNDSTTSEPATAPPTPVGRIGQGPIAPLAVPQQGASVRARDAVGGGGSQRDRDARMALLVGSHKDSKGSRQGLGQDLSLRQKVSPASRGRCNGSLPMILSETDLVSGCVTEPDVRPQSDNHLEAQRTPLLRPVSRDQTPPQRQPSRTQPPKTQSSGARFYANVVNMREAQVARSGSGSQAEHPAPAAFRRNKNGSASRGMVSRLGSGESWVTGSGSWSSHGAAGSGSSGSSQALLGSSRALLGSSQASLSRNDNHSQRNGAPVDGGSVGPPRPSHRRGPRSSDPDDSTSLSPLQTNAIEGQGTMISPEQGLALLAGRH